IPTATSCRNRRWPPDCGSCARAAPARRTYGSSPGSIESACYAIVAAGAGDQWRSTGPASGRADGCSKRARARARLGYWRWTGARSKPCSPASCTTSAPPLTGIVRLAEAVGAALTARAGNKGIKVDIAFVPDLPAMVAGDALRLRAALENLVDNAVKFTSEGAVVFTAGFEPAGRSRVSLIFTVADTGIGIEPREIKNLFRPFTQASEAVARRYGGAGLGLVFVQRIAETR